VSAWRRAGFPSSRSANARDDGSGQGQERREGAAATMQINWEAVHAIEVGLFAVVGALAAVIGMQVGVLISIVKLKGLVKPMREQLEKQAIELRDHGNRLIVLETARRTG
jgi:hypothetical protein